MSPITQLTRLSETKRIILVVVATVGLALVIGTSVVFVDPAQRVLPVRLLVAMVACIPALCLCLSILTWRVKKIRVCFLRFAFIYVYSIMWFIILDTALSLVLLRRPFVTEVHKPAMRHHVLHHTMQPGRVLMYGSNDAAVPGGPPEYATVLSINRTGFREHHHWEYSHTSRPRTPYVMVMLGDSFTLGMGVDDHETFSALLERQLNARARRYEFWVINLGVQSYAPLVEYLALRTYGLEHDPQLIILNYDMSDLHQNTSYHQIAVVNDDGEVIAVPHPLLPEEEISENWLSSLWLDANNVVLYTNYFSGKLFRWIGSIIADEYYQGLGYIEASTSNMLDYTLSPDQSSFQDEWQLVFNDIKAARHLSETSGARFALSTYPWGHQVSGEEWSIGRRYFDIPEGAVVQPYVRDHLRDFANQEEIAFIDLYQAFAAAEPSTNYYYTNDFHWRQVGHEIVAEWFFQELLNRPDLLPAEVRADLQ